MLLERSEQRMYSFLVRKCQKPVVMTVGGSCDLNLHTSLKVFSIYKQMNGNSRGISWYLMVSHGFAWFLMKSHQIS